MRRLMMMILATLALFAAPAAANVITFDTAPFGPGFVGPVSEDGFIYEAGFGSLTINALGHPGQDLEGSQIGGGAVLLVRRADGGKFRFDSVDFAAFDATGLGTQDLIVAGMADGFLQFDVFAASNTAAVPYANWTTEYADTLHNKTLDALFVIIGAGNEPAAFNSAIDNLVVTPEIPEPASLILLAGGLVLFGAFRRRI